MKNLTPFTVDCRKLKEIANHIRRNDHHNPLLGTIHVAIKGYGLNQAVTIMVTEFQNQYLNDLL